MPLFTSNMSRRQFIRAGSAGIALGASTLSAPAFARSGRPVITHGVQSGDVSQTGGIIWSRTDRPSRMLVELAATESFKNTKQVVGPNALAVHDFTGKLVLSGLPAGEDVFYRVSFRSLDDDKAVSEPQVGRLRTAPADRRNVKVVWTGDTAGQGWGINLDWGGMKGYETMRRENPDLFIHSGDTIYADGPIAPEVKMADGGVWKNVVTEEKSKVAETLHEFRGNYQYNLLDENVRRFSAEVPMCPQWDDHETVNNWYPEEILNDDRYTEKSVALLAARANQAFMEYMPMRPHPIDRERVYRKVAYGPNLDVFFLDLRSYRADNGPNRQPDRGPETQFLGDAQIAWLKRELLASRATWKVIASNMPIGLIVYDDWKTKSTFENGANGDGPVLGREHDFADLLRFMAGNQIENVAWITADVHYCAAHHYDPSRAVFKDFKPFWEFVTGPIHAGSFGPGDMDNTFGPKVVFQKSPDGKPNLPPSDGLQFYGVFEIDGRSGVMTVAIKDIAGQILFTQDLEPVG